MRERPILFSGPMVRAILNGRKTQTRRAVKPKHDWYVDEADNGAKRVYLQDYVTGEPEPVEVRCPYGEIGDRLWVREAWSPLSIFDVEEHGFIYRADQFINLEKRRGDGKWRPSIHMPRAASRITLEITGVRVERLQDISEADAMAEGCPDCRTCSDRCGMWGRGAIDNPLSLAAGGMPFSVCDGECNGLAASEWFQELWESINGPESWFANPWVWVIEFRRITP